VPQDIHLNFTQPTAQTYYLNRDLGTNTVSNDWSITGTIAWEGKDGNRASIGTFLEALDNSDRVIARIYYDNQTGTNKVFTNSVSYTRVPDSTRYYKDFSIQEVLGVLTMSYDGNSAVVTKIDPAADWTHPKKLRIRSFSNPALGPVTNKSMDIGYLKFYKDVL